MPPRAADLVRRLGLRPHPEGGWYAEVHRSTRTVDAGDGRPPRAALTGIYFLLVQGVVSRWHRVRSDEVWCHLEGAPLELQRFDAASGRLWGTRLAAVGEGVEPMATVDADVWQSACSLGDYSLVACHVAPGFDFADFSLMAPDDPLVAVIRAQDAELARRV